MECALAIGATDGSGGAGIQADMETFAARAVLVAGGRGGGPLHHLHPWYAA